MGDADIDVKFGDGSDTREWESGVDWISFGENANGVSQHKTYWEGLYGNGYYLSEPRNVQNGGFKVGIRSASSGYNTTYYPFGLYIKIGTTYYCLEPIFYDSDATSKIAVKYGKMTSRPAVIGDASGNPNNLTISPKMPHNKSTSYPYWYILHFRSDGYVDIYAYKSAAYIYQDNDFDDIPSSVFNNTSTLYCVVKDAMTWNGANINEVGVYTNKPTYGSTGYRYVAMADFYLEADEYPTYDTDLDLTKLQSVVVATNMEGGGGATLVCGYDPINDDPKESLTGTKASFMYKDPYEVFQFKGEVDDITIGHDTITYTLTDVLRKLQKTPCNYNPIKYYSIVKSLTDDILRDDYATWTLNEFINKILIVEDKSLYRTYAHPTSKETPEYYEKVGATWSDIDGLAPERYDEQGSYGYLYFLDDNKTSVDGLVVDNTGIHNAIRQTYELTFYEHNEPDWDSIKLNYALRTTGFSGGLVDKAANFYDNNVAKIEIWNYIGGFWVDVKIFNEEDKTNFEGETGEDWNQTYSLTDDSAGLSAIVQGTIDLSEVLSGAPSYLRGVYMSNDGIENSSGFKKNKMKIRVVSNHVADFGMNPQLEVHMLEMVFDQSEIKTDPQSQQIQSSLIESNTATQMILDESELTDQPQSDGVTKFDEYRITDDIETVLENILGESDFILDLNIDANISSYGEGEDLTYIMIYSELLKLKKQYDWNFWWEGNADEDNLKIVDNFDDSGVTLTEADIVNYDAGGVSVNYDASKIRDKIIVIGLNGVTATLEAPTDYTLEYQNANGSETEIYRDNELTSQKNVTKFANSVINKHSKLGVNMDVVLDYTNPYQNYQKLAKGKYISVEINEFSTVTYGKLLIVGMVFSESVDTGITNVTLKLERQIE